MKRKTAGLISILVIMTVVSLAIFLMNSRKAETPDEVAKCIGRNSVLYIQLGCHACETQKKLFGESYQYLNKIDCWFEGDKCLDIQKTPTWIIKGEKYEGVQSIDKLKELTGC